MPRFYQEYLGEEEFLRKTSLPFSFLTAILTLSCNLRAASLLGGIHLAPAGLSHVGQSFTFSIIMMVPLCCSSLTILQEALGCVW